MIVPPFMPPPIEIPGNVSEQPYGARVAFTRQVIGFHALTAGLVVAAAHWDALTLDGANAWVWALVGLVFLAWVRAALKGRASESHISLLAAPVAFVGIASLLRQTGHPQWALVVPTGCALYALFCGRDFSSLGLLSLVGTWTVGWYTGGLMTGRLPAATAFLWMLGSLAFLGYYVYDLAMLIRRRRLSERLGATLDLYRDALNFVTYPLRVRRHWKRHRLWTQRLEIGDMRALAWRAVRRWRPRVR